MSHAMAGPGPWSVKKGTLTERDRGVEALRILSCCAVVGLHTFIRGLGPMSSALYYACGFAVPVFFMVSGAFLLNRGQVEWSYSIRKVRRFTTVLLLWTLATLCAMTLADIAEGGGISGASGFFLRFLSIFKGTFLQYGYLSHCWFLWALAIMYLILPLISAFSMRWKWALFGATLAVNEMIQVFSCIAGRPLELYIPQVLRLWIWLMYFLLGGLVYQVLKKEKDARRPGWLLLGLTAIGSMYILWQLYAGSALMPEQDGTARAEFFYGSLPCVLFCAILFVFAESLRLKSDLWVRLGSLTMGVYLLHKFVIRAVHRLLSLPEVYMGSGLGFLLVLIVSFVVIASIKRFLPKVYSLFCIV